MSLLIKKILEKIKDFETKVSNLDSNKVDKTQNFSGDLNNLKITGFYTCGASTANIPKTGFAHYILVNRAGSEQVLQQATIISNTNSGLKLYQRQYYSGAWTAWQEV